MYILRPGLDLRFIHQATLILSFIYMNPLLMWRSLSSLWWRLSQLHWFPYLFPKGLELQLPTIITFSLGFWERNWVFYICKMLFAEPSPQLPWLFILLSFLYILLLYNFQRNVCTFKEMENTFLSSRVFSLRYFRMLSLFIRFYFGKLIVYMHIMSLTTKYC